MQAQHIVERSDLPDDTERPIERDEAVLERECSNAFGVGLDVTEVPNVPVDVRRRAMRHFEWVKVRTSRRATVAQVARGTVGILRGCRRAIGNARTHWMWKPCSEVGVRFLTSPDTVTGAVGAGCVNVTVPLTVSPFNTTTACSDSMYVSLAL